MIIYGFSVSPHTKGFACKSEKGGDARLQIGRICYVGLKKGGL
jgi:hypothetical protein